MNIEKYPRGKHRYSSADAIGRGRSATVLHYCFRKCLRHCFFNSLSCLASEKAALKNCAAIGKDGAIVIEFLFVHLNNRIEVFKSRAALSLRTRTVPVTNRKQFHTFRAVRRRKSDIRYPLLG